MRIETLSLQFQFLGVQRATDRPALPGAAIQAKAQAFEAFVERQTSAYDCLRAIMRGHRLHREGQPAQPSTTPVDLPAEGVNNLSFYERHDRPTRRRYCTTQLVTTTTVPLEIGRTSLRGFREEFFAKPFVEEQVDQIRVTARSRQPESERRYIKRFGVDILRRQNGSVDFDPEPLTVATVGLTDNQGMLRHGDATLARIGFREEPLQDLETKLAFIAARLV